MDEYIKREDALDAILFALAGTGVQSRAITAVKDVSAIDVVPKSDVDRLEYILLGVMHSVDKWLDGDELEQDEVNRAITMREKTLNIIEGQQNEIRKLEKALRNSLPSYYQVVSEANAIELGKECGRREAVREILEELEKSVPSKIPAYIIPICKKDMGFEDGIRMGRTEALMEILIIIDELKKKHQEGIQNDNIHKTDNH